jgi:hypothetical protein
MAASGRLSRSKREYPVAGEQRTKNSFTALTATVFADKFPLVANRPRKNQTPGDEKRGDLSDLATRWNRFLI